MRFIRKNSPAPTAADMMASAEAEKAAIATLQTETNHINARLADLVSEPVTRIEAEDRLEEIEVELRRRRRTVTAIEAAIPEAEAREAKAALEKEAADLEKRTAKLGRKLEDRYPGLAEAMGSLFGELEANSHEWDVLGSKLREAGLDHLARHDAEFRVRRNFPAAIRHSFVSLWPKALVVGLDGTPVYRGPRHSY